MSQEFIPEIDDTFDGGNVPESTYESNVNDRSLIENLDDYDIDEEPEQLQEEIEDEENEENEENDAEENEDEDIADEEETKPDESEDELADALKDSDLNIPRHSSRYNTPQYIVENDEILRHGNALDIEDTSIPEQAADFINKLRIKRNAFVDQNISVDTTQDFYDFDDINTAALMQKPNNFLIIGKPGVGSSTLGKKFAEKMNLVYLSPTSVVDYFASDKRLEKFLEARSEEVMKKFQSDGLDDRLIFNLICERMQGADVSHRGYILDGWPMIRSEEIPIAEQLEMTNTRLPYKPDVVFIMQMQDKDLFKRRVDQKLDPVTMQVYTKNQYIRTSIPTVDSEVLQRGELALKASVSKGSLITPQTASVTTVSSTVNISKDKVADKMEDIPNEEEESARMPLPSLIVGRLISRLEDHPTQVKRDFDKFNEAIPVLQAFIDSLDRTKVFELDPYWSPKTIVKNAMSIVNALGIVPAVNPIEIFRPAESYRSRLRAEDEIEGYSSEEEGACIPDPQDASKSTEEFQTDWVAVMRSVVVRGRIDPRFRWRISRWKNICPVALKEGRSTSGRPELAYGLHDKVYFLSSPEAVEKFTFNPRQYLLGSMPTSPVKIVVAGHPLAGKTMFARQLAKLTGGTLIDMQKQVKMKLDQIKQRFRFKAIFEATIEAKKALNKQLNDEWKRQERFRRELANKWIADYIRKKAADEINRLLAEEREERMKAYRKLRSKSEWHKLTGAFKASPCTTEPLGLAFSWKKFVDDIKKGVESWKHQDQLELAWELFNAGKLKYKQKKGPVKLFRYKSGDAGDTVGLEEESENEGSDEGEQESTEEESELGEFDLPISLSKRRSRKKRKKKPFCSELKKADEVAVVTDDEDSSVLPSDAEPDESLRIRYPHMCLELSEPIPKPPEVSDQNEQVQAIVKKKIDEIEKWIATLPKEIYEEILLISIRQAEEDFLRRRPFAHYSGGWIVENLVNEVDKWRSILRNPELCPDQVVVLQDDANAAKILNRLKILFSARNPGRKISMRRKRQELALFEGEDASIAVPSNAYVNDMGFIVYDNPSVDEHSMIENDGVGYNKDNLSGVVCESKSGLIQLENDQQRHRSLADSGTVSSHALHGSLGQEDDKEEVEDKDMKISVPLSVVKPLEIKNSEANLKNKCNREWLSPVSEMESRKMSFVSRKMVPFEMNVLVPLKEALEVTKDPEDAPVDSEGDLYSDVKTEDEEDSGFIKQVSALNGVATNTADYSMEPPFASGMESQMRAINDFVRFPSEILPGEDGGDDGYIRTPSGMNTPPSITRSRSRCTPGESADDPACSAVEDHVSVKKIFFKQVAAFNEFWNMVFPVLNEQKVDHWELGVMDQSNFKEEAAKFWEVLEERFKIPPKPVTSGELEEDDTDVAESMLLWGKVEMSREEAGEVEEYGEDDEELGEEDSDGEYVESSRLKGLDNKPQEYLTSINRIESNRLFGDFNYYCPVTLYDLKLIRKGNPRFAVRYQDRLYYMVSKEASARFIENPKKFLQRDKGTCIPPPRICITGAPGCGQKEVALGMCQRSGVFYINFRERLHEIIKSRVGQDVGPFHSGVIVTLQDSLPRTPPPEKSQAAMVYSRKSYNEEHDGESEFFSSNTEGDYAIENKESEQELLPLMMMGKLKNFELSTFPMYSIGRTEVKADEAFPDDSLSPSERYIKAFLESGTQLPSFVLDEFILPLWNEEPFKSTGFVLVGFPNTAKDVRYMAEKMCYPEKVYVMDCKKKTCWNRLIVEMVERLKKKRNKPQFRFQESHSDYKNKLSRDYNADSDVLEKMARLDLNDQGDIRPFSDSLGIKAGKAIYHYHHITTNMNNAMKIELNQRRISWQSINADYSLMEASNKLAKGLKPALKYRSNFFEATYVLYLDEVELLLQNRYFHLSRFKRWCPVEVSKGNQGINLWNAPGVTKYPVLYRNYIYFIAGEENLTQFQEQVLFMTRQMTPLPSVPFHIVVIGPPKAGKTELAKRLSKNLGLLYVSEVDVIDRTLKHSYAGLNMEYGELPDPNGPQAMGFAQRVHTYLKSGHSIPRYMFYESLSFALLDPLAQHHGCVFDGYPMEDESIQELLDRGVIPAVVARVEIKLDTALERCESKRRIPNYNYQDFVQDCDELITLQYNAYGPMSSPCLFRYGKQMRCMMAVDGTQNPATIYEIVAAQCIQAQSLKQRYVLHRITSKSRIKLNVNKP